MDSIVEQAGGGRARVLVGRTAIVTGSTHSRQRSHAIPSW
jgi:hypothetical protein